MAMARISFPLVVAVEVGGGDEPGAEEVAEDLRRVHRDDGGRLEQPQRVLRRERGHGGVAQPVA